VIEQMTIAWRFIFNHHPKGDEIMERVMSDERITVQQFEIWFNEAKGN
jgi:hypothetical protein